jgi:hypothetical protein
MSKTPCDAKAEPLLALALETGLLYEDFMVYCDSMFYREYSKDVFHTELKEDTPKKPVLQLHLSRRGLYDQLPEGLFFQPGLSGKHIADAGEMAAEHKLNKQKEKDIRQFFQPFENEFFWQRVQIETEEAKLLEGFQSGILNDYFIRFWDLQLSIPKAFIVPLILFLPYANKIVGNLTLTAKCLELLLQEPVHVKKGMAPVTFSDSCFQKLGNQKLGVDMVCGSEFMEDYTLLEFTIGPLQHSNVADYLEGGKRSVLLETYYRFFIPADSDTSTNIEVPEEKKHMYLATDFEPVLGYSSVL